MAKRPSPHPTEAEMEILVLLWKKGPLTAGEVQEELGRRRRTGYTTALKLLQTMHKKKLVRRDESERAHLYEAAVDEGTTQAKVVNTLAEQLFSGSVAKLVMHAIATAPASASELAEIKTILAEREKKRRK